MIRVEPIKIHRHLSADERPGLDGDASERRRRRNTALLLLCSVFTHNATALLLVGNVKLLVWLTFLLLVLLPKY